MLDSLVGISAIVVLVLLVCMFWSSILVALVVAVRWFFKKRE